MNAKELKQEINFTKDEDDVIVLVQFPDQGIGGCKATDDVEVTTIEGQIIIVAAIK